MHHIRTWVLLLLVAILAAGQGEGPAIAAQSSHNFRQASPTVEGMADGLRLAWSVPLPEIAGLADGSVAVTIPGYPQSDTPGLPQLPLISALVVLPAGAHPSLEIIRITETELPLAGSLALAPRPAGVHRDAAGNITGGAFVASMDTPCRAAGGCSQPVDQPVTLTVLGTLRGVTLARVSFSPVRLVADQLRAITYMQVALTFNASGSNPEAVGLRRSPSAAADPLLDTLKRSVLNPDDIQPAFLPSVASPVMAASTQVAVPRALLSVTQPGLTAIPYASLAAIQFSPATVNPQMLRLTRAGTEIAMQWDGNGNSVFEAGERLLFYADPRFSRWANHDVYVLSVGDHPGLRMANRPAQAALQPAGPVWVAQTYEINAHYTSTCFCGPIPPGRDGDRWTWDDVRRPDRAHPVYAVGALPALDATRAATLTLWLISYTDLADVAPDHRVDVVLNGVGLGRVEWDGRQAITATFAVKADVLRAENNTLGLNLPGVGSMVEGMWLDGFALHYARGDAPAGAAVLFSGDATPGMYTVGLTSTVGLRGYDVTNPETPVNLLGLSQAPITVSDPAGSGARHYLLASAAAIRLPAAMRLALALQPLRGADYLILAPAAFVPALADLIALRRSQGLVVTVEELQPIYDAFDGRPTPEAIHAYLQNAYATWDPRPTYVLLVGDGTFDPKQYRTDSKPTVLPPYLADVDPWMGETAADNRYALLDGGGQGSDDILPDVLVGRLPVNTITETQIVVAKIVGYEKAPYPGGWNGTVLFVADAADEGGDFAAESAALASTFVQAPFVSRAIYFAPPSTTVTDTHLAILTHWNAGAGLILYNGHASVRQWAAERFFHRDDVAGLYNAGQLPVLLEMTCFTGLFHEPSGTTLDETLLRTAGGGAVAVWGATGLGVATGHQQLAQGFLAATFQRPAGTIGAAALAGKLQLVASGSSALDLVDTFTLLGDPAMTLNQTLVPWTDRLHLPVIQR